MVLDGFLYVKEAFFGVFFNFSAFAKERIGELCAEGVNAVGVLFPVRVSEVAQENDSGSGTGIGHDARPGEARFAEGAGRNVGSHELCGI